jgi:hypothetical protein
MNSPESTRLFHPYDSLEGIIRCSICGELFVRVDHLKALRKSLKKAGLTYGFTPPQAEASLHETHDERSSKGAGSSRQVPL